MLKNARKASVISIFILMFTSFMICTDAASEPVYVIPSGEAVGVKIYTEGLIVVGIAPDAADNDIKINDCIKYANGIELVSNEQFASIVNQYHDNLTLTIDRNNEEINVPATASKSEDGMYKLGLWVRDSTAGIGTVTYYYPENNTFAALGHGITDVDTGNILTVKSGNILPCRILSVTKSENGCPGELNGSFDGASSGDIILNTNNGIYGEYTCDIQSKAIPVASASEIEEGPATVLADVDGSGAKEYDIEITKVSPGSKTSKNMVIVITDESLLSLTGGIVQGMSGAPIIQNGKLAGAVTHVFVNDSAKGYGTFAENMVDISKSIDNQ